MALPASPPTGAMPAGAGASDPAPGSVTQPVPPVAPSRTGPIAYLRRHPILVLMLLSPGIVEYLSGSSRINAVVLNPAWFVIQLALNVGLYLPGVLLVREAAVRWRKGWASILVLGAAYGILEEGVALSTMFDPQAPVVGGLGTYGHWMGVNTVWIPGVLIVHMLWSIALPIFLFGLIFPEMRGRPLLAGRRLPSALLVLAADVAVLLLVVLGSGYFMGGALLLGSLSAIGLLVFLAYRLPGDLLERTAPRTLPARLWLPFVVGVALFPATILVQGLCAALGYAPAMAIAGVVAVGLGEGAFALRYLRGDGAYRARLIYLLGTLAPILAVGAIVGFPIDLAAAGDLFVVALFVYLWREPQREALWPVTGGRVVPAAIA